MKKIALFSIVAGSFLLTSAFTVLRNGTKPAVKKAVMPAFIQGPAKWVLDKAQCKVFSCPPGSFRCRGQL